MKIIEVSINGVLLDPALWSWEDETLTIQPQVFSEPGDHRIGYVAVDCEAEAFDLELQDLLQPPDADA